MIEDLKTTLSTTADKLGADMDAADTMTRPSSKTYCGRDFSAADIEAIKELMRQDRSLPRAPLSRQLCRL